MVTCPGLAHYQRRCSYDTGSPARIGPNTVVFNDPELYRAALAPRSTFRRGDWYKGMKLDPRINNLLSERDEKRHSELRSKMLHAVCQDPPVVCSIDAISIWVKMSQRWKQ